LGSHKTPPAVTLGQEFLAQVAAGTSEPETQLRLLRDLRNLLHENVDKLLTPLRSQLATLDCQIMTQLEGSTVVTPEALADLVKSPNQEVMRRAIQLSPGIRRNRESFEISAGPPRSPPVVEPGRPSPPRSKAANPYFDGPAEVPLGQQVTALVARLQTVTVEQLQEFGATRSALEGQIEDLLLDVGASKARALSDRVAWADALRGQLQRLDGETYLLDAHEEMQGVDAGTLTLLKDAAMAPQGDKAWISAAMNRITGAAEQASAPLAAGAPTKPPSPTEGLEMAATLKEGPFNPLY
jgi:hypothetical protein